MSTLCALFSYSCFLSWYDYIDNLIRSGLTRFQFEIFLPTVVMIDTQKSKAAQNDHLFLG